MEPTWMEECLEMTQKFCSSHIQYGTRDNQLTNDHCVCMAWYEYGVCCQVIWCKNK